MRTPHASVNVTGQCCPLPLIELAKAVRKLQSGEILKVIGDDPVFEVSVRDFCQIQKLEILAIENDASNQVSILIRC